MKFCFSVYDMNGDGFIGRFQDAFIPYWLLDITGEVLSVMLVLFLLLVKLNVLDMVIVHVKVSPNVELIAERRW